MQNKTRLELADYEAENLARLQKLFARKWEFIYMQAEAQIKYKKMLVFFFLVNSISKFLEFLESIKNVIKSNEMYLILKNVHFGMFIVQHLVV